MDILLQEFGVKNFSKCIKDELKCELKKIYIFISAKRCRKLILFLKLFVRYTTNFIKTESHISYNDVILNFFCRLRKLKETIKCPQSYYQCRFTGER